MIGIPRGGIPFQEALEPYATTDVDHTLIVDDVFTTGGSLYKAVEQHGSDNVTGVIVFARNPTPSWIHAIFRLWS